MLATGTCEALVKGSNIDEDEFRTHFSFSKGLNPKLSTLKYLTITPKYYNPTHLC